MHCDMLKIQDGVGIVEKLNLALFLIFCIKSKSVKAG